MRRSLIWFALPAAFLPACGHGPETRAQSAAPYASAFVEGRSGSKLVGTAQFSEAGGAVKIVLRVTGAPPGTHAVHVHEQGDCSAADAKSAGGHFNPDGHAHGAPGAAQHHAGDLGNMEVAQDGAGSLEISTADLTVSDGPRSIMGRALVIHEKADDFVTQPAGNAGARIGCGVIAR
jgi:superoxide dismutase, Cu-Zn family